MKDSSVLSLSIILELADSKSSDLVLDPFFIRKLYQRQPQSNLRRTALLHWRRTNLPAFFLVVNLQVRGLFSFFLSVSPTP